MIKIKPLKKFEPEELMNIMDGYISEYKYVITKNETKDRTVISIDLVKLDKPYIKKYKIDEEQLSIYKQVVEQGLSLGVYDENKMVGIAIAEMEKWNETLWIWEFHIDGEYRRKGVGKKLMEALVSLAKKENLRIITCETQNTNVPAMNFYRKNGFVLDGIDLSYYTNYDNISGEVAIFMKKKI